MVYQDIPASLVSPDSVGALKGNPENRTSDSLNPLDIRMEWASPSLEAPTTLENGKGNLVNAVSEESSKKMEHAYNNEGIQLTATSTNGGARTNNLEPSMVGLPSKNFSQGKRAVSERFYFIEYLPFHLDSFETDVTLIVICL